MPHDPLSRFKRSTTERQLFEPRASTGLSRVDQDALVEFGDVLSVLAVSSDPADIGSESSILQAGLNTLIPKDTVDTGLLSLDLNKLVQGRFGRGQGAEAQAELDRVSGLFGDRFNPETGLFDFPEVGDIIKRSATGSGDVFPGANVGEDLPFVIQSGDIFGKEFFESFGVPIAELPSPGSATEPGGEDRTVGQVFAGDLAAVRGELPGGQRTQAAFRTRVGRGRGSTILGGLGDEEKTTILGG